MRNEFRPYHDLCAAVIIRALRDGFFPDGKLESDSKEKIIRREARKFLKSHEFDLWMRTLTKCGGVAITPTKAKKIIRKNMKDEDYKLKIRKQLTQFRGNKKAI